ncbi:MAG: PIG-L family deacetylase [Anaerolineae bacterium]|nr:PIG-L family deacetylase [Anaerolineae bacterium]
MVAGMNHVYIPERVLVIVAHPDDIEFGVAGTIAKWVRGGARARYVLCTSGQVGIKDPTLSLEEAAAIREEEQTAAAKAVGVDEVVYLRHQDGILENTIALRRELVREIRRFRPEVLITLDPTAVFVGEHYINHPDHRAAGGAALDAVFPAAGMPALFKELEAEGLTAHETRKVYVSTWQHADTFVDITDTIDLKVAALKQHKSQLGDWDPTDRIRSWAAERARGLEAQYIESFRVIALRTDEEWARCKGHVLPDDCPQPETESEALSTSSR